MPTDNEIREHQDKYPVRVWGINRPGTDPCRLGQIAVVPFYDHVDAIKAAEQRELARVGEAWATLVPPLLAKERVDALNEVLKAVGTLYESERDEMSSDACDWVDEVIIVITTLRGGK